MEYAKGRSKESWHHDKIHKIDREVDGNYEIV